MTSTPQHPRHRPTAPGAPPTWAGPTTWAGPPAGPTQPYRPSAPRPPWPSLEEQDRRDGDPVPWAVLGAATLVAVGAATGWLLGLLGVAAAIVLLATGSVLAVVPVAPLTRRGERAVTRTAAVMLCAFLVLGGAAIGSGLHGALTGDRADAPPPASPAAAPVPPPTEPGPAAAAAVPQPVALTDPNRTELLVDRDGSMGVAQTPSAVADRDLTDALRTYCSCEPDDVHEGGLTVALGGEFRRLDAVLGTERSSPGTGTLQVTMRDEATGRVLLDQPVDFTAATPVTVDVTGVGRLDITVRGPLGGVVGIVGEPRVTG